MKPIWVPTIRMLSSACQFSPSRSGTHGNVDDVDAHYRTLQAQGLEVEAPSDAPWDERFFHVTHPDGHELSFAELLRAD